MDPMGIKKSLAILAPLALLATSTSVCALGPFDLDCFQPRPYLGGEAQIRFMNFDRDHGGNVVHRRYPQANLFAGVKLFDYVGLEAGYEASAKVHRDVRLVPGQFTVGGTAI